MPWNIIFFLLMGCCWLRAETEPAVPIIFPASRTNTATMSPAILTTADNGASVAARIPVLHQAWMEEHDPAKRRALAGELVDAVIHDYGNQPIEIADEVARDGLPRQEIVPSLAVGTVKLVPLMTLNGMHSNESDYPPSPIFRRISKNRFETWTSQEGWLFDAEGKNLVDIHVPRRDGSGREWFGAFLPDGTWITTDIWANDQQLNCYRPSGKWKWELSGSRIVGQLSKSQINPDSGDELVIPSIGWARAEKTGYCWLICLGFDYTRGFAFVDQEGNIKPLANENIWKLVYPRAMGVRGMYTSLYINSDDGRQSIHRGEAGHGVGVGWPVFSLLNNWDVVIYGGVNSFGFWPNYHDIYVESEGRSSEPWHEAHRVWFFNADGKYEGEIAGSYLGDAANGRDLLLKNAENNVLQVSFGKHGLSIQNMRSFTWSDGSRAIPLTIYDDLGVGFFLRGEGGQGFTDDAGRGRRAAEVVLAKWKD